VLAIISEVVVLVAFAELPTREAAATATWTLILAVGLVATLCSLLALIALYAHTSALPGRLGRWAISMASLGLILHGGYQWAGAFVVPSLTEHAPEFLDVFDSDPTSTGVTAVGFLMMVLLGANGWALVGWRLVRSAAAPKWAGWLVVVGGLATPVGVFAGLPLGSVILGIGLAWLGSWMWGESRGVQATSPGV
jgi:hypothetical protein